MSILIDKTKRVLVQGITGREGMARTKLMVGYGTNVVAGVTPGRGGQEVEGIPVFDTIEEARQWVAKFQYWYNEVHRHSALKFVTPGQRHRAEDIKILEKRRQLYEAQQGLRPERWSGSTRNWEPEKVVFLNPNRETRKADSAESKAA